MPRMVKGEQVIETSLPSEVTQLKAAGFTEQKARTAAVREADAQREQDTDTPASSKASKPVKK